MVKGYFDVYTLQDMLVNEVIWVAQMYSGEGIGSTELNGDLSYIIPDKGAPIWLDCFVISRDSQNLSEAYEFLNYILRAEINAEIATELWYATPNKEALKYLEKDFLEIKEIFLTDNVLDRCEYYKDIGVLKNEINKIWYKLEE